MPTVIEAASSTISSGLVIVIAVLALGVGGLIGLLIGRKTGRRSLAQRLVALGGRLGAGPTADENSIDGALSYLEQVTGAATEAVTESSAEAIRLRRSLDTLPLGLVLCDESGNVLYRNEMASTMMASRQGDALAAQAVTDLLAQAWDKGTAERILDLYGPPRRTLGVHASQIDDGRRALGVIAVIEDITERRRLDEIRRDFIANVSHELKTPMGALGLLAETLIAEKDRDVARRLADRIHMEAFRVSRIIDDLLDLSRLESELTRPNELVDVKLAILDSVERIRSSAEHASVSLEVIEPESAVATRGDHRQIVSALHALMENAVAYAPMDSTITLTGKLIEGDDLPDREGGTWVAEDGQAGWRSTSDEVARAKRCVRLSVTDVGTGIPANDLERIFERFYRVDRGRSRETGGTGLGLAIVRHVAVNHGGLVEVQSREGEGSTFSLVLPIPEDL